MNVKENATPAGPSATVTMDEISTELGHLRALLDLGSSLMVHSLRDTGEGEYSIHKRDGESLVALLAISEAHAARLLERIERRAGE